MAEDLLTDGSIVSIHASLITITRGSLADTEALVREPRPLGVTRPRRLLRRFNRQPARS
ncbi:hypothetical protein [Streptomyces sp. 184]|uniref:hypothetical protein n=1 Tax=Streptomyces sp. 184 TaxID=1827526 RepID=UPI0038922DB7